MAGRLAPEEEVGVCEEEVGEELEGEVVVVDHGTCEGAEKSTNRRHLRTPRYIALFAELRVGAVELLGVADDFEAAVVDPEGAEELPLALEGARPD